MAKHVYSATFADETAIKREYAKPLTHAWKIAFRLASNEAGQGLIRKSGMSGTESAARKNGVKGKKYVIEHFEVVAAVKGEEVASKAKAPAKPKAVKPFAKGETVTVKCGKSTVSGTVAKVGRLYVYVTLPGFKSDKKIAFADAVKPSPVDPAPVALAA